MRNAFALLCAFVVLGFAASAQEAEKVAPEDEAVEAAEPMKPLDSDVIHLRNGKRIYGQVVKRTPKDIRIEVVRGIFLNLPRKQIERIDYDDSKGGIRDREPGKAGKGKQDLIPGKKLSAELYEKLNKDISKPPLKSGNRALMPILADLGKRAGVSITLDAPVRELPKEEWTWVFEVKPGATLLSLLEDDLRKKLKKLEVVYQYDRILVTTKEAAKALAASKEQEAENKQARDKAASKEPPQPQPSNADRPAVKPKKTPPQP